MSGGSGGGVTAERWVGWCSMGGRVSEQKLGADESSKIRTRQRHPKQCHRQAPSRAIHGPPPCLTGTAAPGSPSEGPSSAQPPASAPAGPSESAAGRCAPLETQTCGVGRGGGCKKSAGCCGDRFCSIRRDHLSSSSSSNQSAAALTCP